MSPGDDDHVRVTGDPGPDLLGQVGALVARAAGADGAPPLNEAALLALDHPDDRGVQHLVAAVDGRVEGYAQLAADGTGQLVVDPSRRRRGTGAALLDALLDRAARRPVQLQVWAVGDSPPARALAARAGLVPARTLLIMRRSLADLPDPVVPAGVAVTAFRPGLDEQAWLGVNARAFAHHPEQGSIDAADLAARTALGWFDPAGFFLAHAVGEGGTEGALLGFHWTKEHGTVAGVRLGEVYVLGVDPDAQGRGLAKALLLTGLAHLRDTGNEAVELYVEADQAGPVGLYRRYGFTEASRDVRYAGPLPGTAVSTP